MKLKEKVALVTGGSRGQLGARGVYSLFGYLFRRGAFSTRSERCHKQPLADIQPSGCLRQMGASSAFVVFVGDGIRKALCACERRPNQVRVSPPFL